MIASTFWKKLIHGAIRCVQLTFFDSSSCSRKLPAVWKNFFGTIGARSFASASVRPLAGLVGAAALEPLAHRRHVEPDDLLPVDVADLAVVVRDELHRRPHPTCSYASRIQPANSSSIDETRKWWTKRSFWYGEALRMRGSSTR